MASTGDFAVSSENLHRSTMLESILFECMKTHCCFLIAYRHCLTSSSFDKDTSCKCTKIKSIRVKLFIPLAPRNRPASCWTGVTLRGVQGFHQTCSRHLWRGCTGTGEHSEGVGVWHMTDHSGRHTSCTSG